MEWNGCGGSWLWVWGEVGMDMWWNGYAVEWMWGDMAWLCDGIGMGWHGYEMVWVLHG